MSPARGLPSLSVLHITSLSAAVRLYKGNLGRPVSLGFAPKFFSTLIREILLVTGGQS